MSSMPSATLRHDWTEPEIQALFELPFNDLIYRAQTVHRQYFDPNAENSPVVFRRYLNIMDLFPCMNERPETFTPRFNPLDRAACLYC